MPAVTRIRVEPDVDESLTLEPLLNLPNDQWAHFTQDVRADGELNPADVFHREMIQRHRALGSSQHPRTRALITSPIRVVPTEVVAAYRRAAPFASQISSNSLVAERLQRQFGDVATVAARLNQLASNAALAERLRAASLSPPPRSRSRSRSAERPRVPSPRPHWHIPPAPVRVRPPLTFPPIGPDGEMPTAPVRTRPPLMFPQVGPDGEMPPPVRVPPPLMESRVGLLPPARYGAQVGPDGEMPISHWAVMMTSQERNDRAARRRRDARILRGERVESEARYDRRRELARQDRMAGMGPQYEANIAEFDRRYPAGHHRQLRRW